MKEILAWFQYKYQFFEKIADNAKEMLKEIPIHSCIRYAIMYHLSKNLTLGEASDYFEIDKSAISRAINKHGVEDILQILFRIPKEHINNRIDSKLIVDFWLENCPVPSGSRRNGNFTIDAR